MLLAIYDIYESEKTYSLTMMLPDAVFSLICRLRMLRYLIRYDAAITLSAITQDTRAEMPC